jgi:hypothetical protein
MPLLDLPNELLQYVSENLKLERDINALTRTNRYLYNLLNPIYIGITYDFLEVRRYNGLQDMGERGQLERC